MKTIKKILEDNNAFTYELNDALVEYTEFWEDKNIAETKKEMLNTKDLNRLVFQAIGQASMCWKEAPTAEFDSQEAESVALKLIEDIKKTCINKFGDDIQTMADKAAQAVREDLKKYDN